MKDNNVKEQHESSGLHASLRLRETGQELTLRFTKGERAKKVFLVLNNQELEGELILADVEAPRGKPNLTALLSFGVAKQEVAAERAETETPAVERLRQENSTLTKENAKLREELTLAKVKLNDIAATEPAQVAASGAPTPESVPTPDELKEPAGNE